MKKRKTITSQVMMRIIPLIIVLMVIVVGTSTFLVNTAVQKMTEAQLVESAQRNTETVSRTISEVLYSLEAIEDALETGDFKDDEARLKYMATTTGLNENIPGGINIGDDEGHFLNAEGWVPGDDFIITERIWYIDGIAHENYYLGAPYQDAKTGQMVVSISSKLNLPGWGNSVLIADMYLDSVSNFVSNLSIMSQGYSFIYDYQNDMIVAHKDAQYNGLAKAEAAQSEYVIAGLQDKLNNENISGTILRVNAKGTSYMVVAQKVDNASWYLVSCIPESIVFKQLNSLLLKVSMTALLLTAAVLIIVAYSISKKLKPIKGLTETIESMTSGDFTAHITISGNNEITTMSEKLKTFNDSMRNTILQLSDISNKLGTESGSSAEISRTLSDSASIQADSMGKLSTTVEDLADCIESIAQNATSLAETVNVVSHNSTEASENMAATVTAVEKGKNDINLVAQNIVLLD